MLRTSTPVWYMHIGAHGNPEKIARTVKAARALRKTPLAPPAAAATPPALDFDAAAIDAALGAKGSNNGGVYQFSIPHNEESRGMELPPSMGTAMPSTSNRRVPARPPSRGTSCSWGQRGVPY